MRVAIVTNMTSQKGLWRDGLILERALIAAGHEPQLVDWRDTEAPARWRGAFDAILFCEVIEPGLYPLVKQDGLYLRKVNPEWEIPNKIEETTRRFDVVLCKTVDAYRLGPWKDKAHVMGFESEDVGEGDFPGRGAPQFLHPCGGSIARGTLPVLEAWRLAVEHGQIPPASKLHVVDPPDTRYVQTAIAGCPGIVVANRLPEHRLRELQRHCAVHVIPSEYEGWGHLFWEALSTGALVIGTDGPWWQEARGAYEAIPSRPGHHRNLAPLRHVEVGALRTALAAAAHRPPLFVPQARARFLARRAAFRARLPRLLERLWPSSSTVTPALFIPTPTVSA